MSTHAEQMLLGRIMLQPDAWPTVEPMVEAGDFYHSQHRLIFSTMARLAGEGAPLDAVTVFESLEEAGRAEQAGGSSYLAELLDASPGTVSRVHTIAGTLAAQVHAAAEERRRAAASP